MEIQQVVILVLGIMIFGYRAYIAWFKPEQHQAYLEWMSRTFYNWEPTSRAIAKSRFSFWFFRIAFLLFFLIIVGASVIIIIRESGN